jgi:hypothetical protein
VKFKGGAREDCRRVRFRLANELVFRLHHMLPSDTSGRLAAQGHLRLGKVYRGIIENPDELVFKAAENSISLGSMRAWRVGYRHMFA